MKTTVFNTKMSEQIRSELIKETVLLNGYDHLYAQIPEKLSTDVRLQTAINAMTDSLYAIKAGDAQHAVTILRDTLERLNQ